MNTTNEKYERAVRQKIADQLGLAETANTFTSQSAQDVRDGFGNDMPPNPKCESDSGKDASNAVSVGKSAEEEKVYITVFDGKDGKFIVVTYGTQTEHGHNTAERLATADAQGYMWDDAWEIGGSSLEELAYAKQHEDFVRGSRYEDLSPADIELKRRLDELSKQRENYLLSTRDEDLSPQDLLIKRIIQPSRTIDSGRDIARN